MCFANSVKLFNKTSLKRYAGKRRKRLPDTHINKNEMAHRFSKRICLTFKKECIKHLQ